MEGMGGEERKDLGWTPLEVSFLLSVLEENPLFFY